jgi:hypothetical protein
MVNRASLTRSVKSGHCQQDGSEIAKESGQRLASIVQPISNVQTASRVRLGSVLNYGLVIWLFQTLDFCDPGNLSIQDLLGIYNLYVP